MTAKLLALVLSGALALSNPLGGAQRASDRSLWVVTEFQDLKGGGHGLRAANLVAERMAEAKENRIVPPAGLRAALGKLGLDAPPYRLLDLSRIGSEALGEAGIRSVTIVRGEVVDGRIEKAPGGRRARLALRVVAYDVASVLPVGGALEIGVSPVRTANVSDDALIAEALRDAARLVVRTMRRLETPTATVIEMRTRTAIIDRGTRAGFGFGDLVVLSRGPVMLATARIGRVEPDRAELVFERITVGIAPGDQARRVFVPPPLPAADARVLDRSGR